MGQEPGMGMGCMRATRRRRRFLLLVIALVCFTGCAPKLKILRPGEQITLDRAIVEAPAGFDLKLAATGLTAPTSFDFDDEGNLIVAENGRNNEEPHIFGIRPNRTVFQIYPIPRIVPLLGAFKLEFKIYGPIGGIATHQGQVYVTHRDDKARGAVTRFGYDGSHRTVVADLPAEGDYGMTDIAVRESDGRLFFGLGTATNSGVVGLDNWNWVRERASFCDKPYLELKLNGYKFFTRNPDAGLGAPDIAVTGPLQPFGKSNLSRIRGSKKPTGAIYSVGSDGGDLTVEAWGIRLPRGIAFNRYGRLYATNNGMELRGTRPVKDDPDALVRILSGSWLGWPDYSTDLYSISEPRFQPPQWMVAKYGYDENSPVIDLGASNPQGRGLKPPDINRDLLLQAVFAPLSGAAKLDFAPPAGAFHEYEGSAFIALAGDRAPFATSGQKMIGPTGYKIVRVAVDEKHVSDFVYNTRGGPASRLRIGRDQIGLERPIDVKFGPDGAMYILDYGVMTMKDGKERVARGSGKIFRLVPVPSQSAPQSQPAATTQAAAR
jgi:glucose/arabinose dehydrogenase